MKTNYPNILIISGNGRNSGKTSLACKIIERFALDHDIVGIKISPHFHHTDTDEKIIANEDDYIILQENNNTSGKDSSRMLEAGAKKVYYIQVNDKNLDKAFNKVIKKTNRNSLIICESGGLRRKIDPGIFLLLSQKDTNEFKPGVKDLLGLANRVVTFDGFKFDFDPDQISVSENSWYIREEDS